MATTMKLTTLRCALRPKVTAELLAVPRTAPPPEDLTTEMGWRAQLDDGNWLVLAEAKTEEAAVAGALRLMADHYDRKARGEFTPPPTPAA